MPGVYIHIPFCVKKCGYCDFYSVPVSAGNVPHEKYLAAMIRQLDSDAAGLQPGGEKISTIYFGGGTPSLMPPEFFGCALDALSRRFTIESGAEISSEVNPGTVSKKWFDDVRREGVTRMSIGVQSFNDRLLQTLGRIHSSEDAMTAIASAQEAGFKSVSIDLMYAIPGEEAGDLEDDLRAAMTFQPEHVSAYQLTNPSLVARRSSLENPPLVARRSSLENLYVSEDVQLKYMRIVARMLERGGWKRYEISNFAKPGFECAHNLNYWRYGEYFGLGAGATSFLHERRKASDERRATSDERRVFGKRRTQVCDVEKYIYGDASAAVEEEIDIRTAMGEFCFMGMRTVNGVSAAEFEKTFGERIEEIYGEAIDELVKLKLVCYEEGRLSLTGKGFELSNRIFERFV